MLHPVQLGLLVGNIDRPREFDGRLHDRKESALLDHPWLVEAHVAVT